jgi:hypothetical protein
VVARHNHIGPRGKSDVAGDIGGAEEELRTIAIKEGGMTATLLFGENVDGSGELIVRDDLPGLART